VERLGGLDTSMSSHGDTSPDGCYCSSETGAVTDSDGGASRGGLWCGASPSNPNRYPRKWTIPFRLTYPPNWLPRNGTTGTTPPGVDDIDTGRRRF